MKNHDTGLYACGCVNLVGAARGRRVGNLGFNPAVFLDVVEKQIVVQVRLQKKGNKQLLHFRIYSLVSVDTR